MSRHGIVGLPAIEKKLQHYLSAKRWRHVSGCARLAAKLAVRHGISPSQAYLAGLLHDCARELPAARLLHSLRAY
ncbi:HDOD domain-containing protein, partial [candidate division FCPU426 bacterium]|nr:HDOD domain-containing protein [candidate division FCPU426 bacterium]